MKNKILTLSLLFGSFLSADIIQEAGICFGHSKLASYKNEGQIHDDILDSDHSKKDGGKFMVGINYGIGAKINESFTLKADIFANFNNTKKEYSFTENVGITDYSIYKVKNSIGIMPVAEFKIHENVSVFAGFGIASTKVEEKHGSTDPNEDDNYKTSKRKGGFAYKVGFDVKPVDSFSVGVAYQGIKTKIKFTEDKDADLGTDDIVKSKASARVNNIMVTFKYHF